MTTPAAIKLPPSATEAELLALPEQGRGFELIDDRLVEKQAGFRHGRAQVRLGQRLLPYDRRAGGGDRPGGWWFLSEQLVSFAVGQTLRPDVAGWLRERLPEPPAEQDTVVRVRPDWIGEIKMRRQTGPGLSGGPECGSSRLPGLVPRLSGRGSSRPARAFPPRLRWCDRTMD